MPRPALCCCKRSETRRHVKQASDDLRYAFQVNSVSPSRALEFPFTKRFQFCTLEAMFAHIAQAELPSISERKQFIPGSSKGRRGYIYSQVV